ncbi:MAG: translation initiation factor eIF-1A [Candidatus Bathyarchaeia archaeon]
MGLGKKKVVSEQEISELRLPSQGEVFGYVEKLLGYDRVLVQCLDGFSRLCRIRGKMKRRVWIRQGDVVVVAPWDFEFETRGDITWRYTTGQIDWLKRNGYLKAG